MVPEFDFTSDQEDCFCDQAMPIKRELIYENYLWGKKRKFEVKEIGEIVLDQMN